MKLVLKLLLLLLFVTGCKIKHVQTERKEEKHKEIRKSKKDSVFDQKKASKTTVFQMDSSQSFEINLETEKDSTGQSKVLEFERIRSPNGEKIIVRGGKMSLKVGSTDRQFQFQTDTILKNKETIRTSENINQTTEKQVFNKSKQVEVKGFSFWSYFWVLILVILIFIAWKLKIFRWFKWFLKHI